MFSLRRAPLAALAALAIAVPASAQVEQPVEPQQPGLIETLEADGRFGTLVQAIRSAGLEEQLAAEGPYTIFAPTDEAFQALPEGKLDELLANPEQLKSILSGHVVQQSLESTAITEESQRVTTLAGTELEVTREGETIHVQPAPGAAREVMTEEEATPETMATVQSTDVAASNGVIHVIDTVLLPAS